MWARLLASSLLAGAGGFVVLSGLVLSTEALGGRPAALWAGLATTAGGVCALLVLFPAVRLRLARFLPIDPQNPVHTGALVAVCLLVVNWLYTELSADVLAGEAKGPVIGPADLLAQELPLIALAWLGVGLFVRRDAPAATRRLGFVMPAWWQVLLGLTAGIAFFAANLGGDHLQQVLDPALARRLERATGHYYAGLTSAPGIASVALLAGFGEESLFRGAFQPRLGLVLTAIAFAAAHPQYGVSVDTALVLVLGFGLGVIRRYTNTTTSFLCHASYNAIVGVSPLLPDADLPLLWAAGAGMGLVVLTALTRGVFRSRRPA